MTDERFVYIQDIKEKKNIARSSHNRRAHAGKSGAVKFSSDYLSKKELKAMNGEIKTYRMNSPMKWKEFKSLPDDLKITYIKALQDKYNVSYRVIAEMFGVAKSTLATVIHKLGGMPNGNRSKKFKDFDAVGWGSFIESDKEAIMIETEEESNIIPEPEEPNKLNTGVQVAEKAVPCSGNMVFYGIAENALKTILSVLGDAKLKISISWEEYEGCVNNG